MAEDKKGESSADGTAEGGEEGAKSGKDKKKLILMIAVPLVLLIGAGAGLYFSGILGKSADESATEQAEAGSSSHGKGAASTKNAKGGAATGGAFFLQIPNMLVNLNTTDGPPRYLRLSVQLELGSQADIQAVESVMPRVVDEFQTYLRELRVRDLRGSAGIYRLQMELLSRVNAAAYPVEVKDVLFQEILIQ